MTSIGEQYDLLYKVIVIGDSGVGKSNLITRFAHDRFVKETRPTIGVEFANKSIEYDGLVIRGHIWDTAGQERFRAFSANYYRGSVGALVVYDVTNRSSFDNLDRWFKELESRVEPDCLFILAGNKIDLEEDRQVTTEEGAKYAETRGLLFIETSAASNTNVDQAFSTLLKEIYYKQNSTKNMRSVGERKDSATEALLTRGPDSNNNSFSNSSSSSSNNNNNNNNNNNGIKLNRSDSVSSDNGGGASSPQTSNADNQGKGCAC